MGFVFGHQDSSHFYLFDWKQTDQNNRYGLADAGMSVKVIDAASTLGALDLWPTAGNGARVRNLFQNRIAWQDFVTYKFVLEVRPGHFTITVSEGDLTLATISIDDATYRSGRFGFYNYSQSAVEYSGFVRQRIASPTYRYDVDAVDPDNDDLTYSLETALSGMNVDRATGLITGDVEEDAGSHDVAVKAADPDGLFDEQRFTLLVERNQPPAVDARPEQEALGVTLPSLLHLEGTVQDELPLGDPRLTARWSQVSGPAEVSFVAPSAPVTDVVFFVPGTYVLRLEANDSLVSATDFVTVVVDPQPSLEGAALVLTSSSGGPLMAGSELTLTASLLDANAQPMRDFPIQFAVNGANNFLVVASTDPAGLARFTYTGARAETDQISATALGMASSLNAALPPFVWTPALAGGAAPQVLPRGRSARLCTRRA